MAIQDFTAGQVLTAAQMDSLQANDYNWTVSTKTANYTLVAADKGTRVVMNAAGATTITVNDSLFSAGDTLYLQNINTGVCTVTAGTATVTSAGSLAIPQWGSGTLYFTSASAAIYFPSAVTASPSGLVRLGGATFTSQTSVAFANSIFTTTYQQYMVVLVCKTATNADSFLTLRMRDNSGSKTGANYYGGWVGRDPAGTLASLNTNGGTSYTLGTLNQGHGIGLTMTVYDPAAVSQTIFSYHSQIRSDGTRLTAGGAGGGVYDQSESLTGIEFLFSVAASGSYQVYGLAMS